MINSLIFSFNWRMNKIYNIYNNYNKKLNYNLNNKNQFYKNK